MVCKYLYCHMHTHLCMPLRKFKDQPSLKTDCMYVYSATYFCIAVATVETAISSQEPQCTRLFVPSDKHFYLPLRSNSLSKIAWILIQDRHPRHHDACRRRNSTVSSACVQISYRFQSYITMHATERALSPPNCVRTYLRCCLEELLWPPSRG